MYKYCKLLGGQDFFTPFAPYTRVSCVLISCYRVRTGRYIASAWCLYWGSSPRIIEILYFLIFISWEDLIHGIYVNLILVLGDNLKVYYVTFISLFLELGCQEKGLENLCHYNLVCFNYVFYVNLFIYLFINCILINLFIHFLYCLFSFI